MFFQYQGHFLCIYKKKTDLCDFLQARAMSFEWVQLFVNTFSYLPFGQVLIFCFFSSDESPFVENKTSGEFEIIRVDWHLPLIDRLTRIGTSVLFLFTFTNLDFSFLIFNSFSIADQLVGRIYLICLCLFFANCFHVCHTCWLLPSNHPQHSLRLICSVCSKGLWKCRRLWSNTDCVQNARYNRENEFRSVLRFRARYHQGGWRNCPNAHCGRNRPAFQKRATDFLWERSNLSARNGAPWGKTTVGKSSWVPERCLPDRRNPSLANRVDHQNLKILQWIVQRRKTADHRTTNGERRNRPKCLIIFLASQFALDLNWFSLIIICNQIITFTPRGTIY